jgi:hypothetical protein
MLSIFIKKMKETNIKNAAVIIVTNNNNNNNNADMPTCAEVIAKFKELHKKHDHPRGYLISTVPDELLSRFNAPNVAWCETYNPHASNRVDILSVNVTVPLMGHAFEMHFDRPLVMEHRSEFESYFGFGGHCQGFNVNRTVARFPVKMHPEVDLDAILLTGTVDAAYAKEAILLLALGGYVKFWDAVHEFQDWFVSAGIPECAGFIDGKELMARIIDIMEPTNRDLKP